MSRRIVILTEGYTDPHTAKTASCMLRYRPEEVVALLDNTQAGVTTQELLGVGGELPVVASLAAASEANTLLIGIAPPGGKIPAAWRAIVLEAISRGMNVISGLHDFLSDDEEFASAAKTNNVELWDIRQNRQREIARRSDLRDDCLRIHTVGHDCSVGKMVTSFELTKGLKQRGRNAKFIATGQTGILIEGDGCPVDCVVADFVSGAVEQMIRDNQHHEILVIEGQGSLVHPSYSGVTLGLLHGCFPHGLVMCYEVGRETITGIDHMQIPPLAVIRHLNETMASIFHDCPVVAVAMNSRRVSAEQAEIERQRVRRELGLPVCDIFRHGTNQLVNAVLKLELEIASSTGSQ